MNRVLATNILRFIALLLADVFIVSRLRISVYAVPHIYFLFILLLPVRTSKSLQIFLGFLMGLCVDIFLNSSGLHTAACTLIAFLRIFILPLFTAPEDYDVNASPNLKTLGQGSFLLYAGLMTLFHHIAFFSLESFKASAFMLIFFKTVVSTLLSVFLIYLLQLLFIKNTKK